MRKGLRWAPEYRRAHDLVSAGQVGRPGVIRMKRYAQPGSGESLLTDTLLDEFDWLRWTFGEVERVFAQSLQSRGSQHHDYALVILRFASGAIAHVEGSRAHGGERYGFEIAGDGGLLEFDSAKVQPVIVNGVPSSPFHEPATPPQMAGEDERRAREIGLAALESARSGRPVLLTKEGQ